MTSMNNEIYILADSSYLFHQLLEVGGNLYDAVSLAVKSALFDTK